MCEDCVSIPMSEAPPITSKEEVTEWAEKMSDHAKRFLETDGSVHPVMLFLAPIPDEDREGSVMGTLDTAPFMTDNEGKDRLSQLARHVLKETRAYAVLSITECWMKRYSPEEAKGKTEEETLRKLQKLRMADPPNLGDAPGRTEAVMVLFEARVDGENFGWMQTYEVLRDDNDKPRIGKVKRDDRSGDMSYEGRMCNWLTDHVVVGSSPFNNAAIDKTLN